MARFDADTDEIACNGEQMIKVKKAAGDGAAVGIHDVEEDGYVYDLFYLDKYGNATLSNLALPI